MTKKKLQPVYSKADEGIANLKSQFISHPLVQHKRRISASMAVGSTEIGWRRGQQTGIYDAYRTLRKEFPKAAKALLNAYGMEKDGSYGMEKDGSYVM